MLTVFGVDFTSRPCARKPITVAVGLLTWPLPPPPHPQPPLNSTAAPTSPQAPSSLQSHPVTNLTSPISSATSAGTPLPQSPPPPPRLDISSVQRHASQASLQSWLLSQPAPFVAALDFPFGQPRALADALGWGPGWRDLLAAATSLSRQDFEAALRGFMAAQPPGHKHLRRAVAAFSREVSPMSLVRTPTAKMFHAGGGLLEAAAAAGCHVAPHMARPAGGAHAAAAAAGSEGGGDDSSGGGGGGGVRCSAVGGLRVLVEAYPALPARRALASSGGGGGADGSGGGCGRGRGRHRSYKSDSRSQCADPERAAARKIICHALLQTGPDNEIAAAAAAAAEAEKSSFQAGGRGVHQRSAAGADQAAKPGAEAAVAVGASCCGASGLVRGPPVRLAAYYGLSAVTLAPEVARQCEDDASGDTLDAVLAALQAAWAAIRGPLGNWGAPEDADPLEGWVADPWVAEQYQAHLAAEAAQQQLGSADSGTAASGSVGRFGASSAAAAAAATAIDELHGPERKLPPLRRPAAAKRSRRSKAVPPADASAGLC